MFPFHVSLHGSEGIQAAEDRHGIGDGRSKAGAEARFGRCQIQARSREGGRRGGEVHGVSEPFRQRIIGNGDEKMRKTKKKFQDVTPVTSFTEMNTQEEGQTGQVPACRLEEPVTSFWLLLLE